MASLAGCDIRVKRGQAMRNSRAVKKDDGEPDVRGVSAMSDMGRGPENVLLRSGALTKASLIYRRTKNLRAVQLLLGHTKRESTVRYLGIEVDDALEMAEQTEV